jgi:hypothetical protein
VLVYPYAFGQYRIKLTSKLDPDSGAPLGHGSIIRECDTYHYDLAAKIVKKIVESEEPYTYLSSLANLKNSYSSNDRIRLDNS